MSGTAPTARTAGGGGLPELRPAVLRVGILVAGLLAWASVTAGRPQGAYSAVALALVALSAWLPAGPVPTATLLMVVLLQLAEGGLDLRLALTVAAVAAHHALCAFLAPLPADARVRIDALRGPVRQVGVVLAGALLLLGGAVGVRGLHRYLPDGTVLVATAALVAAAVVAVLGVARLLGPARRRRG